MPASVQTLQLLQPVILSNNIYLMKVVWQLPASGRAPALFTNKSMYLPYVGFEPAYVMDGKEFKLVPLTWPNVAP